MENPLTVQLYQAAASFLFGAAIALIYDIFRAYRRSRKGSIHHGADILFWCIACGALFYLGMGVGDGQLRIFMAAIAGLGGVGYLAGPSRWILPMLIGGLKILEKIWRFLLRPFQKAWKSAKKFVKTKKNIFPKWRHWFRIQNISGRFRQTPESDSGERGGMRP